MLIGSRISCTLLSRYFDKDGMSMGCLTAPAMMPAPAIGIGIAWLKLLGVVKADGRREG